MRFSLQLNRVERTWQFAKPAGVPAEAEAVSETGQMMSKFAHQEKIKKINPSLCSPATVWIWIIQRRK